jgi:hypothetical protein
MMRIVIDLEIPPYQTQKEYLRANDPYHIRRIAKKALVTTLIIEGLYSGLYKVPILFEDYRLSGTEPVLEHVSNTPHNLAAETIVVGGFGTKDSRPIAEALPQLAKIGAVDALEQDNEGIDTHVIAQKIIKDAKVNGFTEIGLWGDSIGGLIISKVAKEIQEDASMLHVHFMVFDCTPTSINTLRTDKRENVELLQSISGILPDITSHPIVNFLYAQQQVTTQWGAQRGFSVATVVNQMNDSSQPSSKLLAAQAVQVVNPSLNQDLIDISSVKNKEPPMIVSIRPKSDNGDATVISSSATEELRSMAKKAGMPFVDVRLRNIVHGDPTANREQYQEALTNIILPALKRYDISINSRLYAIDSIR